MTWPENLGDRALRVLGGYLWPEHDFTPGEEAEYQQVICRANAVNTSLFFLALSVANFLWRFSDPLVLHATPQAQEAFSRYRWVFSGATLLAGLLLASRPGRYAARALIPTSALTITALVAYGLGLLGGPGSPWFHFGYFALLPPIGLAISTSERVALMAALSTVATTGLLWPNPGATAAPLWPIYLSLLTCTCLTSLGWGLVSEQRRRQAFRLRQKLAAQADELRQLNETLEQRVLQKTAELRALANSLELAREEERARIARELHDELGQELGALKFALALTQRRYRRAPDSVEGELEELRTLLARTSETSRQIMLDLRPRVLDDLGLAAAVEWLARRTEEKCGAHCELVVSGPELNVSKELATTAFRIVQEALVNVARHAKATMVQVELRQTEAEVLIRVADDGMGLTPRSDGHLGMGMIGMRERAEAAGGKLVVESQPGKGTVVSARLPLTAVSEQAA